MKIGSYSTVHCPRRTEGGRVMRIEEAYNICDADIYYATDATKKYLNILGQDKERGYRKALIGILYKHPHKFCSFDEPIVKLLQALNVVTFAVEFGGKLSEDKTADLVSFFIERFKNMNPIPH